MDSNGLKISHLFPLIVLLLMVVVVGLGSKAHLLAEKRLFDHTSLQVFFEAGSFDNDVLLDAYLIPARDGHPNLVNLELLGLKRDRLAYRARRNGEVIAVAVPATVDDGFNGSIDLLVSVDMFGRISAARVIKDINSAGLFGVLQIIESSWMERFSGSSMRDILGISWSKISAEREYDQFVGASITPKAVSNRS